MALLRAVQKVSSSGILIVSLENEGFLKFCLCLTTGLTIVQYMDDISFALLGVHLFMFASSHAMQICN